MKYEQISPTSPWQAGLPPERPQWQRWVRGAVTTVALLGAALFTIAAIQPRGLRLLPMTTDDMQQAIPRGSVAAVMPAASYQTNDVVAYQTEPGEPIGTSRIVNRTTTGIGTTKYRLQDDAATRLERQALSEPNIVGRVEIVAPWVGYALTALQTPVGFALLVVIPLMAVAATAFQDARRQWRLAMYESTFYPGPSWSARHHA